LIRRLARWEILQGRGASKKLPEQATDRARPAREASETLSLPTTEAQVIECIKGLRSAGIGLDRIAVPWMPKASSAAAVAALRLLEGHPRHPRKGEGW
jgi:hypothetical protein